MNKLINELNKTPWDFSFHEKQMTKSKYFNLQHYLEWLSIDTAFDFMLIFDSVRNIGKSTGIWLWIDENIWQKSNYTKRICYWRTNIEKLKKVKESFNALFKNKYLMTDARIYKITLDEKGREIREQRLEIGAICGLNNYENYKSNWFVDYAGIFWDEYNEKYQKKIYEAFIDLFKTVKRQNRPFFFIACGNKVDGDSDLLVNLEIELPSKDYGIDLVQRIDRDTFYINISKSTFDEIEANQSDDIVHRLATKNDTTNRYLNDSGYLKPRNRMVVLYNQIKDTYNLQRTFAKRSYNVASKITELEFYEQAECIVNNKKAMVFKKVNNPNPDYAIVALDNYAYSTCYDAVAWQDSEFYTMWAANIKELLKNKQIYFCSNEAMEEMLEWIINNTQMLDWDQIDPR